VQKAIRKPYLGKDKGQVELGFELRNWALVNKYLQHVSKRAQARLEARMDSKLLLQVALETCSSNPQTFWCK
jgi:hypothetical protein